MKTSQSFTEPSQEQWDEVDRLEHRYFEKFGVRPKRPESITHAQPTMASVGKYIGDLREMLGKDRSSKRYFSPRDQKDNLMIALVTKWAALYQQVHGPCTFLVVPDDVEGEIKKLQEDLVKKCLKDFDEGLRWESGQLNFFAELDGKRVDITEDVHKFIASKADEIRECVEEKKLRCLRCGNTILNPMSMTLMNTMETTPLFHCVKCGRVFDKEGNPCPT